MSKKNLNREDIILAIFNEVIHSKKLHEWKFMAASKDILARLIKLGVISEEFKEEE